MTSQETLIKIMVDDKNSPESLLAEVIDVEKSYARVDNIPLSSLFSFNDIIQFDPVTLKFVKVIEHKTQQIVVRHKFSNEFHPHISFDLLSKFLSPKECYIEWVINDLAILAVPYDWTDEQIEQLLEEIPDGYKIETMEVENVTS